MLPFKHEETVIQDKKDTFRHIGELDIEMSLK